MGKQVRSENTYQKINTIFKRDKYNVIMPYDGYVVPEIEFLENCKWDAFEKIDGTNTRIEVDSDFSINGGVKFTVSYKGKTDNAQIPKLLLEHLETKYPAEVVLNSLGLKEFISFDEFEEHKWGSKNENTGEFSVDLTKVPKKYTIYGEGYGPKIQAGGNYIKEGNSFIAFDVKVDDLYLLRENREEIFAKMGCPVVPFIGQMTIPEAIGFVKKGFTSKIAVANPNYQAEGLVLSTPMGLKDRRGNRIIVKVKTCDWNKYYAKYGTYDKVEQEPNEHY